MTTGAVLKVGLVQMCSAADEAVNVADASRLIREAARAGATYVQTPEFTALMEMRSAKLFAATKREEESPALAAFRALAAELGIWLHIGSMGILVAADKMANRSYLIRPDGTIAASYDKIHMFDAALGGGESFRESKNFAPGGRAVVADLGLASPDSKLGLTVCYDVRFPGLYRSLAQAGAGLIAVPSAFTRQTGEAHWHTLLKCRAIETASYILAAAQAGRHECGRETYGHSLIVSPWGEIVAEAPDLQPSVIVADIELDLIRATRNRMPSLEHDRPFVRVDVS